MITGQIQAVIIHVIAQREVYTRIHVSHWSLEGPNPHSLDWCITICCDVKATGAGPGSGYICPLWASQSLALEWEEMSSHILAA